MKEKILICVNSLRIGGTERVVSILLNNLKDDFEIHLVLYNNTIEYCLPAEIKIFHLNQAEKEGNLMMMLKGPLLAFRLRRYCRQNSVNTVVAFLNRACYLAAITRKLFGYKGRIVMCQRTHQSALVSFRSNSYKLFSNLLLKWSFSSANIVLANSHEIASDLRKYLPRQLPVRTIYNPMDLEEAEKLAQQPSLYEFDPKMFHFVVLGGLRREKNHSLLLHAFSLLNNERARLWIVGGGELESVLKTQAEALSISSSIVFCGNQPNPFPILKQANCVVLPSLVEGFPNSLLEGLALGKAVISTDCMSGPREILAPGTTYLYNMTGVEFAEFGLLVPVQNPALLSLAMNEIMENDSLRHAYEQKGKARIRQFSINGLKPDFIEAFLSSYPN